MSRLRSGLRASPFVIRHSTAAAAIRRFGFTVPILIDDENRILAGHGRLEAARQLALTEVPCIRIGTMSEADKRAYVLADNRLAEKLKLAVRDGVAQIALQLPPDADGLVHFRRKHMNAVAAIALGPIKRHVREAQQVCDIVRMIWAERYSGRSRDAQMLVLQSECFLEAAERLLDDALRMRLVERVGRDGELIAAQPRQYGALRQAVHDPPPDGADQLIPHLMPKRVVHILEIIEIEHGDYGKANARCVGAFFGVMPDKNMAAIHHNQDQGKICRSSVVVTEKGIRLLLFSEKVIER